MSIHYKISPELGIAFMFCEGDISEVEYFRVAKTMYDDKAYTLGMCRIVDLFSAKEHFSLAGMRSVIKYREEMAEKGIKFEYMLLLTHSRSMELFVETMKLLITKTTIKFEAVSSLEKAIALLGLQDRTQEIVDFYTQNKRQVKEVG